MIETQVTENCVRVVLKGVLNGNDPLRLPATNLSNKEVHLIGEHIDSWNTDFVITLFNALQPLSPQSITYSGVPSGMEQLLRLAFQAPRLPQAAVPAKDPFLERLGDCGIRFCRDANAHCGCGGGFGVGTAYYRCGGDLPVRQETGDH